MAASRFIATGLRFKEKIAVIPTAVSFFIIVVSICISSGFRKEIRNGVSAISGDIQLTSPSANTAGEGVAVNANPSFLPGIVSMKGVKSVAPAIYRPGVIGSGEELSGVVFKGVPASKDESLTAEIPRSLARTLSLSQGNEFRAYFIGERVQVRKFTVKRVFDAVADGSGNPVVLVPIEDLRRVNGWEEGKASALEIMLEDAWRSRDREKALAVKIAGYAYGSSSDDDDPTLAVASADRYYNLFDWLGLIDFNVLAILLLMILVAGFNMISGLLITLFRNISSIGMLKTLGMDDRGIGKVFLRLASKVVLTGMATGNGFALLLCAVQHFTHFIKLNPDNYFVSFMPVSVDLLSLLAVNAIAYIAIMLMLLLPALFIARVDPAETVRMK